MVKKRKALKLKPKSKPRLNPKSGIIIILLFIILVGLVITLIFAIYTLVLKSEKSSGINEYRSINGIGDANETGEINETSCAMLGCSEDALYVGSVNSDKYYSCECHYAKTIKKQNIICFSSDAEAEEKGYEFIEC
ncbi:hypothetical protein J4463_02560 [Candidatus Pacearchaeota archaeon]|nr:hypothetical protein [Candidatus Pacearchaeota archaeon]